jgi:hypothetical protein
MIAMKGFSESAGGGSWEDCLVGLAPRMMATT